jgi:hypothetical protein
MIINKIEELYDNVTIVVNSCDEYKDVLDIFFTAFNYNWKKCPFKIVINTETNQYPQYNARTQNYTNHLEPDNWGDRLLETLSSIDSEFIIMLYDDYILEKNVDMREIDNALIFLQNHIENSVVYLVATPLVLDDESKDNRFLKVNASSDYRLNSAPAIWRKKILISYTCSGDTPWAWEVFGSYRTFHDKNKFYSLNPAYSDIYPYDYSEGGAIYRGKWVSKVIERIILKYNININWTKRGISEGIDFEKRSILWKFRFVKLGFKMIGAKMTIYLYRYFREKLNSMNDPKQK